MRVAFSLLTAERSLCENALSWSNVSIRASNLEVSIQNVRKIESKTSVGNLRIEITKNSSELQVTRAKCGIPKETIEQNPFS